MNKYTFLIHHSTYQEFLQKIRSIGVVHISTRKSEPTASMQELYRQLSEVNKARQRLESLHPAEEKKPVSYRSGEEVFNRLKEMEKEMEHNHHKLLQLEKDKKQIVPWGNFDWTTVEELAKSGLRIRFMYISIRKYQPEWEEKYPIQVIRDLDGYRYFLKIERDPGNGEEQVSDEISEADEVALPRKSLQQVNDEMQKVKAEAEELQMELHNLAACCIDMLKSYGDDLHRELAEQNAVLQTSDVIEGTVRMLEGWVPDEKKNELDAYLDEQQILYVSEKPDEEDKVPILLKNNKFAKHYEVIGNLYELPNHRELDLVPFFAPFYMMFFGFSLGDAGYGLVILLAATFFKRKMVKMKSVLTLAQWLGLATVIFGLLTGTFFGINLIDAEVPWLEKFKSYMINTDQLFYLAIILGAVQIIFGMVLKIINISRTHGFLYSLSTIGWLILILGIGAVLGLNKSGTISADVAGYAQTAIFIIAGLLVFIFNHPKRNVFINVGAGVWDVYNMFTGLLGDILSYIRLFALGVSSAILGLVFNSMAMSMRPDHVIFGPLVMIIILLFGHGITIFMASLGAFVHPIRLTFVEFYKNAGFSGGGKAYSPFSEPASGKIE